MVVKDREADETMVDDQQTKSRDITCGHVTGTRRVSI